MREVPGISPALRSTAATTKSLVADAPAQVRISGSGAALFESQEPW
jgi:hypothetical protein